MDYQANSKRSKEPEVPPVKVKTVEKIVTTEVVTRKKGLGRKFKDLFIATDVKGALGYICTDVLLPSVRNMIVDGASKGVERLMYGENSVRNRPFGPGPRVTYNSPVNRGVTSYPGSIATRGRAVTPRLPQDELVLSSQEEAETVLERMGDIISQYEVVSLADFNEMVGLSGTPHTDNKWGWTNLRGASVQQIREGYLLSLPPAEPI